MIIYYNNNSHINWCLNGANQMSHGGGGGWVEKCQNFHALCIWTTPMFKALCHHHIFVLLVTCKRLFICCLLIRLLSVYLFVCLLRRTDISTFSLCPCQSISCAQHLVHMRAPTKCLLLQIPSNVFI